MSLNKFMHPENIYKKAPDFKTLALKYPEFRKHVTQDISGKIRLDFQNPNSLRILSQTLLLEDFNLRVEIPEGSLIPTVPSRLNYLLWINDLLKKILDSKLENIKGIDIGTGSSAVYCLLASKHFNWSMLGTEVDQHNYLQAVHNVEINKLQDKIKIRRVEENQILDKNMIGDAQFHFSMCNPPFFTRESGGEQAPGKEVEVKTAGGEVKFVCALAEQSLQLKEEVRIFSTLLGHKSSLGPVKQFLNQIGVNSLTTTEFCQGRTMRWGIAWTFQQLDISDVRSTKFKKGKEKPFVWSLSSETGTALHLFQTLKVWFTQIKVDVVVKKETKHYCSARLSSSQTLWRNQRKQRRERTKEQSTESKAENAGDSTKNRPENHGGKFSEKTETSSYIDSGAESCLLEELLSKDAASCLNSTEAMRTAAPDAAGNTAEEQPAQGQKQIQKLNGHLDKQSESGGTQLDQSTVSQLECNISIRLAGPVLCVELVYLDGQAGRDGVHQLLQYIKNKHSTK